MRFTLFIVVLFIFGMTVLGLVLHTLDSYTCNSKLTFMELNGDYSYKLGCYVKLNSGKKVLLENYKAN